MGKRRFAQLATSDEEDEEEEPKKEAEAAEEEEEEEDPEEEPEEEPEEDPEEEEESAAEENAQEDAKTIGDVIKVTGKGRRRKKHFSSFEFDGNVFELEDPVLLTPEAKGQKPYVAIIKDITVDINGNVMVNGQWFYRPEEAEKKGGGNFQGRDTREIFYSWHRDEVPAESVMHKCVVHFIPPHKQLPRRSQHPGFVVQKVYDTDHRKLFKLTDTDYEDSFQREIEHLISKTHDRIGDLPDENNSNSNAAVVDNNNNNDHNNNTNTNNNNNNTINNSKRSVRRRVNPIDVTRHEEPALSRFDKVETPGSGTGADMLKCHAILVKFEVLTGDSYRDKWLDKLLQGMTSKDNDSVERGKTYSPEVVVPAITGLERVVYDAFASDFQKYNQKMRQLDFNLRNNPILAKRLLNKELDPAVILTMSPTELKAGWTDEEKSAKEPEEPKQLQMTDARCTICTEKKVGISEIIHAGGHDDRYQLECVACGHTWYTTRDAVLSAGIDAPSMAGNVGSAPWATAKFEDLEKKLVSPRDSSSIKDKDNKENDKDKTSVLDKPKSFSNRSKPDDTPAS